MKFLCFFFCLILTIKGFSQVALLDKCYDLIQLKEFRKAESAVLLAEKNVVTANDSRTHYLKAFIYKELFIQSENIQFKEDLRRKAIYSIKRCTQLDFENTFEKPLKQLRDYVLASAYNDGTEYYNNRKFLSSIECFHLYIELTEIEDSNWLDAHYYIGSSFYSVNNLDSAKLFLEFVRKKNYDEPVLFVDLSYLYKTKNDPKAIATVQEGLAKYPDFFDLQIAELNVLSKFKQYDTLDVRVDIFLEQYPNNIDALLLAGTTYEKLRNEDTHQKYFGKAEKVYQRIIDIDTMHYDGHYNLGVLYYNEAVDIVNKSSLETNIEELNRILEKSTMFFEKSLPLLTKIYRNVSNPEKVDIKLLKALQAIYYNLNMRNELNRVNDLIKSIN